MRPETLIFHRVKMLIALGLVGGAAVTGSGSEATPLTTSNPEQKNSRQRKGRRKSEKLERGETSKLFALVLIDLERCFLARTTCG